MRLTNKRQISRLWTMSKCSGNKRNVALMLVPKPSKICDYSFDFGWSLLILRNFFYFFFFLRNLYLIKNYNRKSFVLSLSQKSFDALLPNEALPAVKSTCISISAQKCETKTMEWRTSNLNDLSMCWSCRYPVDYTHYTDQFPQISFRKT